jgi:hypothetical protein
VGKTTLANRTLSAYFGDSEKKLDKATRGGYKRQFECRETKSGT